MEFGLKYSMPMYHNSKIKMQTYRQKTIEIPQAIKKIIPIVDIFF